MLWIQLLVFVVFLTLLISKVKNIALAKFLSILLLVFTLVEIGCIYLKSSHIDMSIISNIDKRSFKVGLLQFKLYISLIIIILTFVVVKIIVSLEVLLEYINKKKLNNKLILLVLMVLNLFPNSIIKNIYETGKFIVNNEKVDYKDSLKNLEIDSNIFVTSEDIVASSGKNVVIIYLESFEQGFFDKNQFSRLTPNLDKLKKEWKFYNNYIEVPGTGWTMGAMYSSQTGLPTIFGLHGNEIFNNVDVMKTPSVGSILNKAGYNQIFLKGADLKFSGTGNFFEMNGYKVYGNSELSKEYSRNAWGVRDKDLFEEAKKRYIELSNQDKPFNLTMLTVDNHFPNGLQDERLREVVGEELTGIEFTVKSTDYLIGDFISFLEKQPNYENTVVFIIPDHTIMGNEIMTPIVSKLKNTNRKLWLLTNTKEKLFKDSKSEITFYDIPKLLLEGISIKTNVKFVGEFLNEKDKNDSKLLQNLQALNLSLVEFSKIKKEIFVRNINGIYETYIDGKKIDEFDLTINNKRYYSVDLDYKIKGKFSSEKKQDRFLEDYSDSKIKIEIYLDKKNGITLDLVYNKEIVFSKNEKSLISLLKIGNYSINYKSDLKLDINTIKKEVEISEIKEKLKEIKELNSYFDTLKNMNKKNVVTIISIKDEGSNQYLKYKEGFDKFNLMNLNGKIRNSYVGVFNSAGKIYYEETSNEKLNKSLSIKEITMNLVSAGYDVGSVSKIILNRIDYSKDIRGLNIVVLDTDNFKILDAFNVDTYGDSNLIIRR